MSKFFRKEVATSASTVCNNVNGKYLANSVASQLSADTVAALHAVAIASENKDSRKKPALRAFAQELIENNARMLRAVASDLAAQKEYIRQRVMDMTGATAMQKRKFLSGNDYGRGGVMSARSFDQLCLLLSTKI